MGFLRILLASLVLASHAGVAPVMSGVFAVECFFVISGFYMQLLIHQHYAGKAYWKRKFYTSRFLRIFIPYWCIVAIILLLSILSSHSISSVSSYLTIFSNIFIIGSEHIKLWRLAEGCNAYDWQQLIIPTIWSVGMELLFYLIAPFILCIHTPVLIFITFIGLVTKIIFLFYYVQAAFHYECGDGLINGLFPLEIGMFTLGALLYRFHIYYTIKGANPGNYCKCITAIILATLCMNIGLHYISNPLWLLVTGYSYTGFILLFIPPLFKASLTQKYDRTIGELSYTFYLCHFYIIHTVLTSVSLNKPLKFIIAECTTLGCAYSIHYCIEKPLDKLRHYYFR